MADSLEDSFGFGKRPVFNLAKTKLLKLQQRPRNCSQVATKERPKDYDHLPNDLAFLPLDIIDDVVSLTINSPVYTKHTVATNLHKIEGPWGERSRECSYLVYHSVDGIEKVRRYYVSENRAGVTVSTGWLPVDKICKRSSNK
ncbi:hypothetical protein QR680_004107 [Steinernema hermaphroditum]|uniref:Uncharacterized protein n=1 Tax=Steinernema hermaphroditum TaxID=289476 RepID=A0AA39HPY4_9BILA|nr:hypothetical protein QR680_004107 [Steinernema hermaphroditum]